jgi:hypothetical protein
LNVAGEEPEHSGLLKIAKPADIQSIAAFGSSRMPTAPRSST